MKFSFLLTEPTLKIVGGYKMVYLYSNYLALQGHEVSIYYICILKTFRDYLKVPIRRMICKKNISWFNIHSSIHREFKVYRADMEFEPTDYFIITASTLMYLLSGSMSGDNIFHYIQDHEVWANPEGILEKVYSLNIKKIVVSKWLKEMVDQYSPIRTEVISNGIDLNIFHVKTDIRVRFQYSVVMLYHDDARKGCQRGIKILKRLKREFKDLQCVLFGSPKRSKLIPDWIDYYRNVRQTELAQLYNQNAIFFSTSYFEGFGLTGLESMASGCALISTDTKGVNEYAKDGYNALLSQPDDDEALYINLKKVLLDNELRIQLALNGQHEIENFSQELKCKQFEDFLISNTCKQFS